MGRSARHIPPVIIVDFVIYFVALYISAFALAFLLERLSTSDERNNLYESKLNTFLLTLGSSAMATTLTCTATYYFISREAVKPTAWMFSIISVLLSLLAAGPKESPANNDSPAAKD